MNFLSKLFGKKDKDISNKDIEAAVASDEVEHLKEKLMKIARNEIRAAYSSSEAPLPLTASKIGGKPAVPEGFIWPEYSGTVYGEDKAVSRPLSFMAQIDLEDIAELDTEGLLPKTGVLSFFYEQLSMRWGFDPADKGCARVYYFPETEKLSLIELPEALEDDAAVPELAVSFEKHISLPCIESCSALGVDCDFEVYEECMEECGYEYDGMGDVTKLLGYPDVIQSPMEKECETVTRGYRNGSPDDYAMIPDDVKADIADKAKEWTLLFQMGTVTTDEKEIMFGDCGHIYFWIKKADLEACNFDDIWLVLQCG